MASLTSSRGLIRGGLMWAREPRFLLPGSIPSLQPWITGEEKNNPPSENVSALVSSRRLVFLGEQHGEREVVKMELAVMEKMLAALKEEAKLKVIVEHFSLEQQSLLDSFISSSQPVSELIEEYLSSGDEGHDLIPYSDLLNFCRDNRERVRLMGGFVPRRFARRLMKEPEETLKEIRKLNWLPEEDIYDLKGSSGHYNLFDSLISGRDINTMKLPGEKFRKIFPCQVLKDAVMAAKIDSELWSTSDPIVVILGSGHCDHGFGVPERITRVAKEETVIVSAKCTEQYVGLNRDGSQAKDIAKHFKINPFKEKQSYPGDVIFLYDIVSGDEDLKSEFADAYDSVASTAHREGDLSMAQAIMTRLGYTPAHIATAGEDAYNYQGVGCPHHAADLQPGMTVLDLGSGLGVDSFIAAEAVGPAGKVIGLDLSLGEVEHATKRAEERSCVNVTFVHGDLDSIPLPDGSVDRVISNGAFCLAPDKAKAFHEVERVLKPSSGRFSIACTTLLSPLSPGVHWPICMRVFLPLSDAERLLRDECGFEDVLVDQSDSRMTLDISPEEEEKVLVKNERKSIHVGSKEFQHLQDYDMDQLCARVVLSGRRT